MRAVLLCLSSSIFFSMVVRVRAGGGGSFSPGSIIWEARQTVACWDQINGTTNMHMHALCNTVRQRLTSCRLSIPWPSFSCGIRLANAVRDAQYSSVIRSLKKKTMGDAVHPTHPSLKPLWCSSYTQSPKLQGGSHSFPWRCPPSAKPETFLTFTLTGQLSSHCASVTDIICSLITTILEVVTDRHVKTQPIRLSFRHSNT